MRDGRQLLRLAPVAVLLSAMLTTGCYVTKQAFYQNNLFNSRRKVAEVLADKKTPAKTRKKLELVQDVLRFAHQAGLNSVGAYTYYIETDEPVVSYLVQASEATELKAVTWWFPVVGSVPYLGYFDRSERDAKAAELRAAGYDVHESGVGAFSSLGWFEDPIFSPMLARGEAELAHLFLHELTHRTLWISGSTEFNENLAEYVAEATTIDYLRARKLDKEVAAYLARREDRAAFKAWLRKLKKELTELYAKPPGGREELLAAKAAVFQRYAAPPLKPTFAVTDYVGKASDWNNAAVLGASLYSPDTKRFAKAAKCVGGSVKEFLVALEEAADDADDGFAALDALCAHAKTAGVEPEPSHVD